MKNNNNETIQQLFDKWIWEVVELRHLRLRGKFEPQDIYSCIDLTDAKISFLDGISPSEYNFNVYL